MTTFNARFTDSQGNVEILTGDSVAEIAAQMPALEEDSDAPRINVVDEAGFVRGFVRGSNSWNAA